MGALTLVIGDLPELEVVESTINDDQFSDLVIRTQGELPIDERIVVATYGPELLDVEDLVDRQALAMRLLALLELEPEVVAVDFLLERERPDWPEGDAMLSGLIESHPNLYFGVFREDSLDRFRFPPEIFGLDSSRLGAVNLMPAEDRTIRTFRPRWGTSDGSSIPTLSVRVAEIIDPEAVDVLRDHPNEELVIDYAGGIGEVMEQSGDRVRQVFPNVSLDAIYDAFMTGDTEAMKFYRDFIQDKAVLVGYGDVRNSQVMSIVDRFYTPLKPESNALPDMHGVTIHANILNTILSGRIVRPVPAWVNVLWGALIVFLFYLAWEYGEGLRSSRLSALVMYGSFVVLLIAAVTVPILMFRYTPYKLSVYAPFAGLILGRLVLGVYERAKGFSFDLYFKSRLRRGIPESFREELRSILAVVDPLGRHLQTLQVLQRSYHACVAEFALGRAGSLAGINREALAKPAPRTISPYIEDDVAPVSPEGRVAEELLREIHQDQLLCGELRRARSILIAYNEISRQQELTGDIDRDAEVGETDRKGFAGMLVQTVNPISDAERQRRTRRLFRRLEALGRTAAELTADRAGGWFPGLTGREELHPLVIRDRCERHDQDELFIYVAEQVDANEVEDRFDILFAGNTIACQLKSPPPLGSFREAVSCLGTEPELPPTPDDSVERVEE